MGKPAPLRSISLAGSRLPFIVDNLPYTEIRTSVLHGHGLFAAHNFELGEVLGTLDGQTVEWNSYDAIQQQRNYGVDDADLFMEWNALSPKTLLIRPFRTKYSFINHSRTPNVELAHDPLRIVSIIVIAEGSEITLDYRKEPLRKDYVEKATFL